MVLHRKRGLVGEFEAAIAAVEQADMRGLSIGGQGCCVDCKTVVHAGDFDRTVAEAFDRMVCAAMALMHLFSLCANGKAKHLMAKANAEHGFLGFQPLLDDGDGINARCGRVAGAV